MEQTKLVYLTDERNTAILPDEDGTFDVYVLTSGEHYKVVGTAVTSGLSAAAAVVPAPSHTPVAYHNAALSTRKSTYLSYCTNKLCVH